MKKIALTAVIVASLSTGVAVAEPFNNRGIDYRATVQSDASVQRESVTAQANRFNNQGSDYVESVSGSADTPRADVNVAITGFNNRDHVAFSDKRQGLSDTQSDERIGYAR